MKSHKFTQILYLYFNFISYSGKLFSKSKKLICLLTFHHSSYLFAKLAKLAKRISNLASFPILDFLRTCRCAYEFPHD